MRDEFLKYLGGQNKAKCADHKLCLIRSMKKVLNCSNCNTKLEYYVCPSFNCKSCICQTCFKDIRNDATEFLGVNNENQEDDNNSLSEESNNNEYEEYEDYDSNDDEGDGLEEPYLDGDYLLNGKSLVENFIFFSMMAFFCIHNKIKIIYILFTNI